MPIGSGVVSIRSFRTRAWPTTVALGCAALISSLLLLAPSARAAVTLPANFDDQLVASVEAPTAVAFTPDGRLLITTQPGVLQIKDGALDPAPALDISSEICGNSERGMLGVAVDPLFASNHFIYIYYTFNKFHSCEFAGSTSPVNRVSRFELGNDDVVDPKSEKVLIDNIPAYGGNHNGGDVQFGKDGYLYVSVGDGGCDYANDSGCGPANDASRDQFILLGKILRITRDGDIPPTNPFQGAGTARCNVDGRTSPDNKCQETFARGLRNPFRIAFDPNAVGTRFFINDVGEADWEEVDDAQAGADYGWNVREGPCETGSTTNCGLPPPGMTNPVYAYEHGGDCNAITGGAFVPAGIWGAEYNGAYLYEDLLCGKIIELTPVVGGGFTAKDFLSGYGSNSLISMTFGPAGTGSALYYITWSPSYQVRRIVYTGAANRAPQAALSANKSFGALPLAVNFDGTRSSDPDGDTLSYDWDFGDGSAHGSGATTSHTYDTAGTYTVTLRVSDGRGGEDSATIRIDAGNTPPVPQITSPATDKLFSVGEQIMLAGGATDPQEGPLPATALSWVVIKHHNTHTHPFLPATPGNDIQITAPPPEDLDATEASYLEIRLTATDSHGLSATTVQNLYPDKVDLRFDTEPSGLALKVNGVTITTPRTLVSWKDFELTASAPDQNDSSGQTLLFTSWSDGRARSHTIRTPSSPAAFTATFNRQGLPVGASPLNVSLVPAFRPCASASADSTHGRPLELQSCANPRPESSTVRAGSSSVGFAQIVVCDGSSESPLCNPPGDALPTPDVFFMSSIRDVRCASSLPSGQTACAAPGADYNPNTSAGPYAAAGDGTSAAQPTCFPGAGSDSACIAGADLTELAALPGASIGGVGTPFEGKGVRITDRDNGLSETDTATVLDLGFPIPLDCLPTASTTVGSTCGVNTTANALAPGIVQAGNQAVWQLGQIAIKDSGPDGVRGNSDDELFQVQGVFIP